MKGRGVPWTLVDKKCWRFGKKKNRLSGGWGNRNTTVYIEEWYISKTKGFFQYFFKLSIYFSCDCLLQGVSMENCMYTGEDKVPCIYTFFFSTVKGFLPSCYFILHIFIFFLPFSFQLPTSACKTGAEVVSGQLRAVGSTQRPVMNDPFSQGQWHCWPCRAPQPSPPGCHKSRSLARLVSLWRGGMQYVQPSPLRGRRMFLVLLCPERSWPVTATLQSCSKPTEWETSGKEGQVLVVPSAQICVVPACPNIHPVTSVVGFCTEDEAFPLQQHWGVVLLVWVYYIFLGSAILFWTDGTLSWVDFLTHGVTPGDSWPQTTMTLNRNFSCMPMVEENLLFVWVTRWRTKGGLFSFSCKGLP